jgi:hypothetical protein
VAVASADGDTTEYLQGDVFAKGRFSVIASWQLANPECQEALVNLDDWESDTDIW